MTIIETLDITDFRGFEGQHTFNFEDAELILFLGMNGFGKTSSFDAIEWCLTGRISRYEQYLEPGRKRDFSSEKKVLRNNNAQNPRTAVKVRLSDGINIGRRVNANEGESDYGTGDKISGYNFGLENITKREIDSSLINSYFSATHILSQETIHHFVTSKRPEERYKALSINFGTSLYEPFEENAQNLIKLLSDEKKSLETAYHIREKGHQELLGQLRIQEAQILDEVNQANLLIRDLVQYVAHINLANFELKEGQILLSDGKKLEDISTLFNLQKKTNEQLEKRNTILISLEKDFKAWEQKHSQLKVLDKEISDHKLHIDNIGKLKSTHIELAKQTDYLKSTIETEIGEKNIAQEIDDCLPEYLSSKTRIDQLYKEAEKRNNESKEYQNKLNSYSDNVINLEKHLKDIRNRKTSNISTYEALKKKLNEKDEAYKHHLKERADTLSVLLNLKQSQISQVKEVEIQLEYDLEFITEDTVTNLKDIFSGLDEKLFLNTINLRLELEKFPEKIKSVTDEKQKLEKNYQIHLVTLSKSKALLTEALKLIDETSNVTDCPICEVSHDTTQLISKITVRIGEVESKGLEELKIDLEKIENKLNEIKDASKSLSEKIELSKRELSKEIKVIIKGLSAEITEVEAKYFNIKAEIEQIDTDELNFFKELKSLLEVDIKDLSIANELLIERIDKLSIQELETEQELDLTITQKQELHKAIELHSSQNKVFVGEIASLQTSEYEKVDKYLVEKGFSKTIESKVALKKHLEEKSKLIAEMQARDSMLKIEADKALKDAEDLELLRSSAETEKAITNLTSQISEINRFLADYKLRCTQLKIDLSQITTNYLYEEIQNTEKDMIQLSKALELLTGLTEKSRSFEQFNKEEKLRQQIKVVDQEIQNLMEKIARTLEAKKEIETLKRRFPKEIRDYIYDNLDNELFNKIYRSLDPHRRFQSIKLGVDVVNGKLAINLEALNDKIKARPEFTFSSGQLNTLGVSIFLSMALRQNWLGLNSILLDDPIQNLDDINVLAFIDMIRSLFDAQTGKQIIMSTHDERFYHLVKKKFIDYKVKSWRFESYGKVIAD